MMRDRYNEKQEINGVWPLWFAGTGAGHNLLR